MSSSIIPVARTVRKCNADQLGHCTLLVQHALLLMVTMAQQHQRVNTSAAIALLSEMSRLLLRFDVVECCPHLMVSMDLAPTSRNADGLIDAAKENDREPGKRVSVDVF